MGTGKSEYSDWEVRVQGLGSQSIGTWKSESRDLEVRV